MLHELSHAWFNRKWFSDRWLSEGFAQVYSNLAVDKLGGTPLEPEEVQQDDPGKVTLEGWSTPDFTDADGDRERYGYNAAFWVVQRILDEIDVDKMAEVLTAVDADRMAYAGHDQNQTTDVDTDWRRFLDLVENIGGSQVAEDLVAQYVISPGQHSQITARSDARVAYDELVAHGGEWAPPLLVRREMEAWSFSEATTSIKAAQHVLDMRDQIDADVAEIGTTYPADDRTAYESETNDMVGSTAWTRGTLNVADRLLEAARAERGSHGILGSIGLIGSDIEGTLDEAKAAFAEGDLETATAKAHEVIDAVNDETSAGLHRVGIALGLILLIAGSVFLLRRRKARTATIASAQEIEGVDAAAEGALGVGADPVEAGGEQTERVEGGPDVAVEQVAEVDLATDATTDARPDDE